MRKKRRLAGCYVSIPPWVGIASRAFSNVIRLSNLLSSLQACAFLSGDPDGGTESTARQSTFLRKHLVLAMLSAGRTLGLRAPDCAKETSLPGLSSFDSRQSTFLQNLAITAIPELPHPHPAVLGYMERPARLQFMVGQVGLYSTKFSCFARQQVDPAPPASRPQAARKMWKRHCRRVARAKRSDCRLSRP